MIIEGLLTIAIILADEIQPNIQSELSSVVCYETAEGDLTCYPVDESDK